MCLLWYAFCIIVPGIERWCAFKKVGWVCGAWVLSVLCNAYPSTHSDHEGDGADHLQNKGDT